MFPDTYSAPADPREIAQLLDDHHLVVIADRPDRRSMFTASLRRHLEGLADTQVVGIDGLESSSTKGLSAVCEALSSHVDGHVATIEGIVTAVRDLPSQHKRQYLIWDDADEMLEGDVEMFGRVVNALLRGAAEREYVSQDALVLLRVVFVGTDKLGAYAEESNGQFSSWLEADLAAPTREVARALARPPVLTYRLDG